MQATADRDSAVEHAKAMQRRRMRRNQRTGQLSDAFVAWWSVLLQASLAGILAMVKAAKR